MSQVGFLFVSCLYSAVSYPLINSIFESPLHLLPGHWTMHHAQGVGTLISAWGEGVRLFESDFSFGLVKHMWILLWE